MKEIASRERMFCDAARGYLLSFSVQGVTPEVLDSYLEPRARVAKLSNIYWQLLWSSQNANMKTAVITGSMENGMMALSDVLFGFVPAEVTSHYGEDSEAVLDVIVERVHPRGQIRRSPSSIWPQFCRSIISGAKYLGQFPDATSFYARADAFAAHDRSLADLPLGISTQVSGLGFALACDFLKEIGCSDIGKPDVHIRKILAGLGVIAPTATDVEIFGALVAFARSAGLSTYHVDKLMWLVGSGSFYRNPEIGRLDTDRDGFVRSQRCLLDGAKRDAGATIDR